MGVTVECARSIQLHQTVRAAHRQRAQQGLIQQRVDSSRGSDAQRQNRHRDQGESGTVPQLPQRGTQIDQDSSHLGGRLQIGAIYARYIRILKSNTCFLEINE